MIENVLGAQIARFRKEAKMTQEALGAAVGVSTQAVSRWECGGLPDAALLPAIADALHVSIDALFARDASQPADLSQTIAARLAAAPEERRVLELARLFWRAGLDGLFPEKLMSFVSRNPDPLQSCQIDTASVNLDGPPLLMTTSFSSNDGLTFGICAKDMSFMSAFPEPEKGYAAYFSSCEEYRALFSALARPQLLEQLFFLCGCKAAYLFAATLGLQADMMIRRLSALNMARGTVAHSVANALIEDYCDEIQAQIAEKEAATGLFLKPRYSPGYGDFALQSQKEIFARLECAKRIGLTLTDTMLMVPFKSVTAVIGVTDTPTCTYKKCRGCANTDCEFREI